MPYFSDCAKTPKPVRPVTTHCQLVADVLAEHLQDQDFRQLFLGVVGPFFREGEVLADSKQVLAGGDLLRHLDPVFQVELELPVDEQIRVAADRAGEMAVVPGGQGVVPDVRRGVQGPLQAPEHHHVHRQGLLRAFDVVQDRLHVPAVGSCAAWQSPSP